MSATQKPLILPRLGAGDHFPVFSCPDTDDDMFEFYVDVVGKPVVMIFCDDQKPAATHKFDNAQHFV